MMDIDTLDSLVSLHDGSHTQAIINIDIHSVW